MNIQEKNRRSPLIKNNRFYNDESDRPESFILHTIPNFILSLWQRKKRLPENKNEWFAPDASVIDPAVVQISWIGHATFLIHIGGFTIITDPIFGSASPFFPRIFPPGMSLDQLPPIDFILLSHNHPDHCDMQSLHAIKNKSPHARLLVPQGDKNWLDKKGFSGVVEHDWWQTHLGNNEKYGQLKITFLPAHHWSAKHLFDRNRSLWGSWMIQAQGKTIYFAGDTAYAGHFKDIAQEFTTIDLALMPIAPGEPHPWMRKSHVDAHEAVQAFLDLHANHFVPMHWGTFQFGKDYFNGPLLRLEKAWKDHEGSLTSKKLSVLKIGQRLKI